MSHYPNLSRDSSCKCKYCLTHDHFKQKRINQQRRTNDYKHEVHGHLSGGGGLPPAATCGRVRGASPSRYPKVEQQNCCKGLKYGMVEDAVECHKTRFQELRKTWSEFARVCNCPNCKGSLQKEHYLDKLAESADRVSYNHCEEDCCCSASSIPSANHKSQRPINFNYDRQHLQKLQQQQQEDYYMQAHQQQMSPGTYEVSSDEGLTDSPGNTDCKCQICSCGSSKNTCNGGHLRSPTDVGVGMPSRCGMMKKERFKHSYY